MITLTTMTTDTPVGAFTLIADSQGIVRASGFGPTKTLVGRLPQELHNLPIHTTRQHPYILEVQRYFAGATDALDAIPRTQTGSKFQMKVWRAIGGIDYGQTLSYKQLAATAGSPKAFRAVGTACGQNKLILLVPCHRVLKNDGGIGNYLYGSAIKEYLLRLEAAHRKT